VHFKATTDNTNGNTCNRDGNKGSHDCAAVGFGSNLSQTVQAEAAATAAVMLQ